MSLPWYLHARQRSDNCLCVSFATVAQEDCEVLEYCISASTEHDEPSESLVREDNISAVHREGQLRYVKGHSQHARHKITPTKKHTIPIKI